MRQRAFAFAVVAVLLGLAAFTTSAWADSSARIVRLSLVDGNVTIDRADGQGDVNAIVNMPVVQGAAIRTGNDGYAELEFERGSTVRLTPNSSLFVDRLSRGDDGREDTALTLRDGLVYFSLDKHEAGTFQVNAGGQQITVPKNAHFRIDTTPDSSEIAVFDGEVKVSGAGSEPAAIKKGHTLRFGDNGQYEVAKNITGDPTDSWDSERLGYRDTYAYQSSPYNGYSSSYVYGLSDLNYWGNYYYAPGWGWVWRPFNTGYSWSPFSNGAWVFYPSWGWTWVSMYPWGWTPYRYGNWVNVPSYGWCWQPTNTWANWHAVPPAASGNGTGTVIATRPAPPARPPLGHSPSVILVGRETGLVDRSPGGRPALDVERTRLNGAGPGARIAPGLSRPGAAMSPANRPATGVRPGTSVQPRPSTTTSRPAPAMRPQPSPRAPMQSSPRMSAPPPMRSAPAPSSSHPTSPK